MLRAAGNNLSFERYTMPMVPNAAEYPELLVACIIHASDVLACA